MVSKYIIRDYDTMVGFRLWYLTFNNIPIIVAAIFKFFGGNWSIRENH